MMDIVERLYANTDFSTGMNLAQEAAREIERLRNDCKTAWNCAAAERDLYAKAQNEVTNLSRRLQDGSPIHEATIQHMAMRISELEAQIRELMEHK